MKRTARRSDYITFSCKMYGDEMARVELTRKKALRRLKTALSTENVSVTIFTDKRVLTYNDREAKMAMGKV